MVGVVIVDCIGCCGFDCGDVCIEIIYVGFYCVYVLVGDVELWFGDCIGVVGSNVVVGNIDDLLCGWIGGVVVIVDWDYVGF